jgi:hypothetical protein
MPGAVGRGVTTGVGPAGTGAPVKEIKLDAPSDPNRVNEFPQSVWDDLEKFAVDDGQATGIGPSTPVARATAPVETAEGDETAAPTVAPQGDDAEIEQQVSAHKTLKDVRTAFKEQLKREREWSREKEQVKIKLTDYETKFKSGDTEAARALAAELEASKAKATELETRIRALDYTKSEEFREKFVKPVTKALENAYTDLKEMAVTDENGEVRAATEDDFKALLQMPLGQATTTAKRMFGDLASEVLAHRRAIVQIERSKREALENSSKASEEAIQRQTAEQAKREQRLQSTFQQRTTELETKYPDLFKSRDGDAEGNELMGNGRKLVELLNDPALEEDNRIRIAAEVNARTIGYGRLLRDFKRATEELKVANAKLKAFDGSEPREGTVAPNGVPEGPVDPMQRALQGLEKFATPMR